MLQSGGFITGYAVTFGVERIRHCPGDHGFGRGVRAQLLMPTSAAEW